MIWVTWRQHRSEALIAGMALVLLALLLVPTGLNVAAAYRELGVGACIGSATHDSGCTETVAIFQQEFNTIAGLLTLLIGVPALTSLLIGAPLIARELEQRTQYLIWTQSVTRTRWLTVKLGLVMGACLLIAAIATGLLMWWRSPLDQTQSRLAPFTFDIEGIVPVAYTAFAMALAIAAGTVLRKAIPAMALAFFGFVTLRIVCVNLRYYFLPPITFSWDPLTQARPTALDRGWTVFRGTKDHMGHIIADVSANSICSGSVKSEVVQCYHNHGWLMYETYQPDSRFWMLQSVESAIFLVVALALVVFSVWWVRRRSA